MQKSIVVVQSLSCVRLLMSPWTVAHQPSLSPTISKTLPKFMSIGSVMLSNHFILFHPLLWPLNLPSIRIFSSESALRTRWPKYWSFSFSISPSNEYSELISFRIDWFSFQSKGFSRVFSITHSLKVSVFQRSAFFMVQLSHPHDYWKTIALTMWTFVSKVMSLLFNMLSSLS